MSAADSGPDPLVELAEEFAERYRRGERPSLTEYTAKHPGLAERIRKLFPALVLMEEFGAEAAAATGPFTQAGDGQEPIPAQVGRYRIDQRLGQGGMGAVYCGLDADLDRTLAVKVLLAKHQHKDHLRQRFLEEAQIMGRLQHPGIAPIHEIGRLEDGRPFFSMKQVQGRTLGEMLKAPAASGVASTPEAASRVSDDPGSRHRNTAVITDPARQEPRTLSPPRSPADMAHLLGIFEQVCQTVAYAHAQGIIHRDLKPANIMVGAFGEVQVMDWGLAKRMMDDERGMMNEDKATSSVHHSSCIGHRSDQTEAGRVLGTPAYMAPEQARGDVEMLDERCDVFGLGGILCEMLTEQPPFPGDTQIDSHRRAAKGDLTDAFTRLDGSGADAELVNLAKQCLAAEKERRPQHAGAVAEAVAAYQAQVRERLRQAELERAAAVARAEEEQRRREAEQAKVHVERGRRRAQLALAASLLVLVAGASLAGLWYVSDQAERAAEGIRRDEKQAREKLEQENQESQRQAEAAAQNKYREVKVTAALDKSHELRQMLHAQLGNPTKVPVLLSDIDSWQRLVKEARAAWQLGQTLAGESKESLPAALLKRLHGLNDQLKADENDYELARKLDDIRMMASTIVEGTWDPTTAGPASAALFAASGYDIRPGQEKAVVAKMKNSAIRYALVAALDHWAEVTTDKRLVPILLSLAKGVDPDSWRGQVRDAVAVRDKGQLLELAKNGNLKEQTPQVILLLALKLLPNKKNAADLIGQALLHHPGDFWLHLYHGNMLHDAAEQVGCFRAALAIRPKSSPAHNNLGVALYLKQDVAGAIACYKKALDCNSKLAQAHYNLGLAQYAQNDLAGAIACFHKVLECDPKYVSAHSNLGVALKAKGDLTAAIACYHKALEINPKYAPAYYNLGNALKDKNDLEGAIACYQKTLECNPKLASAHHNLGAAYGDLGQALLKQGQFSQAKEAILLSLKLFTPGHPLHNLAQTDLMKCEQQLLALDQKLTAVLRGHAQPKDGLEQLALADHCWRDKQLYAAAVKFFAAGLAEQPGLARLHRYHAACAAALAAAGQGKGADKLDANDKAKLRQQALDWLKAEREFYKRQVKDGQLFAVEKLVQQLSQWQRDPELASVRDAKQLAQLPEAEQQDWQQFWSDVAKLLKEAQGTFTETKFQGTLTIAKREQVYPEKLAAGKTYVVELESKQFETYPRLSE
jgi:serine/threonine protein kinase/tetratricopeptide (TPR) repeat protein